jgi:SAM-dependent methyltransferase
MAPSHYGPERHRVVRCLDCGMIYTNPQMTTYLEQVENLGVLQRHLSAENLAGSCAQARMQIRLLEKCGVNGPVLDFGSGNGAFVFECLQRGHQALGHDLNAGLVAAANAHWKFNALHSGHLDDFFSTHPGPYGAIMANQVMEHIQRPGDVGRQIVSHLDAGGLFYVDVPYVHQPGEWFRRGRTLDPTSHWNHFSIRTLKDFMCRIGLTPIFASAAPGFVGMLSRLRLGSLSITAKRILPPVGSGVCVIGKKC